MRIGSRLEMGESELIDGEEGSVEMLEERGMCRYDRTEAEMRIPRISSRHAPDASSHAIHPSPSA